MMLTISNGNQIEGGIKISHIGITYDSEIHTRARIAVNANRHIARYVDDCVEAGICPKCGKNLMVEFSENKESLATYCSDRECGFIK